MENGKWKIAPAFTLIELLVVITILGILAGLTLATYGGTQARSRDSRRKTDLDAIKKALELAKQDSVGSYYYPKCNSGSTCELLGGASATTNPNLSETTGTPYMPSIPKDPKTSVGYSYSTFAQDGTTACSSNCPKYSIIACLENTRDSQKDSTENDTVCPGTSLVSYTVKP